MNPRKTLSMFLLSCLVIASFTASFAESSKTDKKAKSDSSAAAVPAAKDGVKVPLVDINSASKEELMKIAGIGTRYSDDIIKGRPYKNKRQLLTKKILPDAVYNAVSDKIIAKQKDGK